MRLVNIIYGRQHRSFSVTVDLSECGWDLRKQRAAFNISTQTPINQAEQSCSAYTSLRHPTSRASMSGWMTEERRRGIPHVLTTKMGGGGYLTFNDTNLANCARFYVIILSRGFLTYNFTFYDG